MFPFTFYATFDVDSLASYIPPGIAILLPASSWTRKGLKTPVIPPHVTEAAADSGGFVASRIWGEYRYSLDEYVSWLMRWKPRPPSWAAMMDYCCEPELRVVTRERQQRTTANAYEGWRKYKDVPFVWCVTVQGLDPSDYEQHARELKPLIKEMQAFYTARGQGQMFRVGVGTLCRRADSMTIRAIVQAIRSVLPTIPLHLWGVKLASIRALDVQAMNVISTDSAAWHGKLYNANRLRQEAIVAGMSMRAYSIKVKLPEYIAKVTEAANNPAILPPTRRNAVITQAKAAITARGWTLRIRARRAREYVYAVRRYEGRIEERYLGALDAFTVALAGTLPNRWGELDGGMF